LLGAAKLARAVALARRVRLSVCCDNDTVAEGLSDAFARAGMTLDVLIECDTGSARCGVATPSEAVAFAERMQAMPGLRFAGFMTYPVAGQLAQVRQFFAATLDSCRQQGIEVGCVSNGGTPDMYRASTAAGITEHRAGSYIYNDRMVMAAGAATLADCAMTVLATVVSRPAADRAVIDTGSKSLAADLHAPDAGHGTLPAYPDVHVARLNEEHGILDLRRSAAKPAIGERLRIVPNHCCVVSNLHDRVYGVRGDEVVQEWVVAARGRTG
jgi:D-serine deaminase-like pyridoxal phosphate-dependent protein